jgi:predicted transposase YdaD
LSTLSYWAGTLVELLHAPNGRQAVETLFRYITAVAELPAEELTRALRAAAPRSEEALMTIAEQLRAEGRAEGRAERGQAVLLRLLSLKFGEIPGSLRERVTQASEQDLDRWTERILTAASLDDVFEQAPSK